MVQTNAMACETCLYKEICLYREVYSQKVKAITEITKAYTGMLVNIDCLWKKKLMEPTNK